MKSKIESIRRKVWAVAFLFPLVALAQFIPPASTNLPTNSFYQIIRNIMMWLLGLLGFVAVIGFVISGIMYLVAAGDEEAQKRAKRAMFYSITGVIVGLVGLVILFAVERMLGATTPQF